MADDAFELPPDDPRDGAHESLVVLEPSAEAVERCWRTYWAPVLTEDGTFNLRQLKAELHDAWFLVNEARKVYRHVTGGLCENLCASAEGITALADRRVAELTEKLRDRVTQLERELEAERARSPRIRA